MSALDISGVARADGQDELALLMHSSDKPASASVHFTITDRGNIESQEMDVTSPLPLRLIRLFKCDQNMVYTVSPALKAYTAAPISASAPDMDGIPNFETLLYASTTPTPNATGKVVSTLTVKDLGMSVAPGSTTTGHHYTVDDHRISSGAAGALDIAVHSDFWVDPNLKRPDCPDRNLGKRVIESASGANIEYDFLGDVDLFNQMNEYLPIAVQVAAPKSDLLFQKVTPADTQGGNAMVAIPADYKKMTLAQFTQAQQDAILDAITGPAPPLPNATKKP